MFVSNNKARILHLRASQFVGGPERQILHHAATAASPEREVWIGSFRDGPIRPELLQCAEQMGLSTFELSSGRFDPRTIFELARRLRHNEISLLCTHGYKANIVGWAASRLTGCPQIAFVRGWTGESWRVQLYDRLDRLVLRWTDWVVCVSHAQAKQLREKRKGRHAPVVIANAALLPREEVNPPIHRLRIRRALGLREDAFLVCAVGRLSPEKGHRYLLRAIAALVDHIPTLRITFLGEGHERKALENEVARLGVQNYVVFAGFKKDIQPWIQACDLLVNPSLTEGVPNVILEAMALGTPVVATRVGGVPDLVQDQQCGVLVPPGDPEALAVAIHDLFQRPTERVRLAQNATKQLEEYSPAKQNQRLLELYARALEGPRSQSANDSVILTVHS